jgi:hypothetical protein
LSFQLDDRTAAYRRGEAIELARARRESLPAAGGGVSNAPGAPDAARPGARSVPEAEPADAFAPENPGPVDEALVDALFESLCELRAGIAEKRAAKIGKTIPVFLVAEDAFLHSISRHPPPTFEALDRDFNVIKHNIFVRNHKQDIWRAIENGAARFRGEPPPHVPLLSPPPGARGATGEAAFEELRFNGTQPTPTDGGKPSQQWHRAGQQRYHPGNGGY